MTQRIGMIGAVLLVGSLAACERQLILTGQRFDARTPLSVSAAAAEGARVADGAGPENRVVPVALGTPVANAEWTHRAGAPGRIMPHVALSAAPQLVWQANIGAGNSRRARIATAPVVGGGQVYAIDARNRVTALSAAGGGVVWSFEAAPAGENPEAAKGGGLAYAEGRLFVSTGFGELIALDARSGAPVWRKQFEGPVSGAPAVVGGTVYLSGRDATAWAVQASDGRQIWAHAGARQSAGLAGGIAPAVDGRRVVMPFASGQVVALDRTSGDLVWTAGVVGQRMGRSAAFVADLTGDPVISGRRVYVGSAAGRTAAFDLETGAREWEATEGAMGPVWPVGDAVFLVSDLGQLVRLDARSGEVVWSVPMGHFLRDTARRQQRTVAHFGPVLAGGRLIVGASDGYVRFYAPDSGQEIGRVPVAGGVAAAPAVAGGVLYVVTGNGQVQAFR